MRNTLIVSLVLACLVLLLPAGCRDTGKTSSVTFSSTGKVSMEISGARIKVEDGILHYNGKSYEVPDPSSRISIKEKNGLVSISIDGKHVLNQK